MNIVRPSDYFANVHTQLRSDSHLTYNLTAPTTHVLEMFMFLVHASPGPCRMELSQVQQVHEV